jgi:DNA-binding NtrC family response regulator
MGRSAVVADDNAPTIARVPVAPKASALRHSLLVIAREGTFTFLCPPSGVIVVGRGKDADLRIDDPNASRKHAVVHIGDGDGGDGAWTIEDCGSLNATRLGERALRAHERAPLHVGDRVLIGATMLVLLKAAHDEPTSVRAEGGFARRIAPMLARVAHGEINVLLLGETGVSKEVLARQIHELSPRAKKPLVALNCAALSASLLESELFGHEKGAFTGATQAKAGLLESAEGGTVFLDEIGELPLALQAKLLRVLEQREVQRVGSLRPRAIDVRFVAATNRDLAGEAAAGRFRQDLYFRLDGISIAIPPLRERLDELQPLARSFIDQACERAGRAGPIRLAPTVVRALQAYAWPGNVRELRNVMERAVLLCPGTVITPDQIPPGIMAAGGTTRAQEPSRTTAPELSPGTAPLPVGAARPADERARIVAALAAAEGNQTRAARALGISRRTLITRIEEYDLPRPRKGRDEEG